jgi:hypothetical protein
MPGGSSDDRSERTGERREVRSGNVTETVGWWLRLQLGLGIGGGAVWVAGTALEADFLAGIGVGLLIAAVVLRLGRRAADRGDARHEGR